MIFPHKPTQEKNSSFFMLDRHGYNIQFSPFYPDILAVATSQCFGSVGTGTLFLLKLNQNDTLEELKAFHWTDGFFDLAWSKQSSNLFISACGDGGVQLWNIDSNETSIALGYSKPKTSFNEHSKEVCCVDWSNLCQNSLFLSSSWDCSIKLWNPNYDTSVKTYNGHKKLVYESKFSKNNVNNFMSVSADGYLKIWDILQPQPVSEIVAHRKSEVLTCDWNEFDKNVIATGGSDGLIKGWDLRYLVNPLFELFDCEYAVRRVRFSPFDSKFLASVSYDHTARIWNWQHDDESIETLTHHTESNYGLDWNRLVRNQLADCGWDSMVKVYIPECLS